METTKQTKAALAGFLTLLLTFGLVSGLYWNKARTMTVRFNQEELRADSLLSVKLRLEGDVSDLTSQLETAGDENESVSKRLSSLNRQLNQQDALTSQLRQRNNLRTRTIHVLNQNLTVLTTTCDSLENQLAAVIDKVGWLSDANELLLKQNKNIQQQLTNLTTPLTTKISRSAVTGDSFMVESTKTNQKETAKAKKVNALTISLNVPVELQLNGVQDVFLSLTDGQYNAIMPPVRTATVSLATINEVLPVHAIQSVDFSRHPKRISLSFKPGHTLKPGKYRASVYTKDTYLGSVEFQLRDSFWFF